MESTNSTAKLDELWAQIGKQNMDFSKITTNTKVAPLLENKPVIFSDVVHKINERGKDQKRILIITTHKVFNVHNNKSKREMHIQTLNGISKNIMGKQREFTLHFNKEYDYRFYSDK